jgi:hypothetical protein
MRVGPRANRFAARMSILRPLQSSLAELEFAMAERPRPLLRLENLKRTR